MPPALYMLMSFHDLKVTLRSYLEYVHGQHMHMVYSSES